MYSSDTETGEVEAPTTPTGGLRTIVVQMAALMMTVEFVIMLLFAWAALDLPDWQLALLDSLILSLVVGPLTYWGLIRPRDRKLNLVLQALDTSRIAAEEQASIDPLTSVLSRRAIFKALDQEWQRAERYTTRLCCMMVDVDDFKKLNDSYGHQVGDQVLQQVAAAIGSQCRSVDRVGRYGGEEFLVISPESNLAGAGVLAERIREAIAQISLLHLGQKIRTTVSIGVAERSGEIASSDALVAAADEALYDAKARGRNRVIAYEAQDALVSDHESAPEQAADK